MIHVTELRPPLKISGLSSFAITFDYNPVIVETIKSLPAFYYHKKTYTWEIPADLLATALDRLTFLDEITLTLVPDLVETKTDHFQLTPEEILTFRVEPFKHQVEGVNFGLSRSNGKWLLLDGMGCGKSLTIMMYAETLKKRGLIDHCMIICGVDSLRQNWKREIQKFSNESCMVLGEKISRTGKISYESVKKRVEILKQPISEFFVIVNVATLRSDEIVAALKSGPNNFGLIAVDEIHRIATKTSAQGANLLKLQAPFKVGATGSLVTNSPLSCYVPLAFTENDKATLTTYKMQYCEKGGFGDKQIIGYKNLGTLREEIEECSIRRTLDEAREDMPPKFVTYEVLEMSEEHRKFYEAIKEGVKEEADRIDLKPGNLLALTTRLRQATACPGILTTQNIVSTKVERAAELVEDLVAQGEKVVVFSNFKDPVYQLAKLLEAHEPLVNTGDQDDTLVGRQVEIFQEDPKFKVFLGTHGKCGTGWTLNAASYLICLDTPWTDASLSQSEDRIYRVTNTRPAIVIILACMDTIDERVREIVETKKELADYLVDGKENSVSVELQNEMRNILRTL